MALLSLQHRCLLVSTPFFANFWNHAPPPPPTLTHSIDPPPAVPFPPRGHIYSGETGTDDNEGDILLLDPNQKAVQKKTTAAPAFEKQLGWREWQAEDALTFQERIRKQRTAWGWRENAGAGRGEDPVKQADCGRRQVDSGGGDLTKQIYR